MTKRGRVYRPKWKDKKTGERRESKSWWIDFTIGDSRIRENTGSTLKSDAEAILDRRRLEERARIGGELLPSEQARVTVAELLDLVEQRYEAKRNRSIRRARVILGHLCDHLGGLKANSFKTTDAERYIVARRKERKLADATLRRELEMLRLAFRLGHDRGLVRAMPKLDDALPPESKAREDFFTDAELATMLEALPVHYRGLAEAAAITGWRSEALRSRIWNDVRDGWLTLNRASSKNKKPYRFPVKGRLAEILEEQRQLMQDAGFVSEHVFFDEEGTEIGYEQLRWRWDLARRETKITHTFHSLRRTAARNMIRAGVPQRVAQELLGMETAEIFERYAIVDETVLEEGAAKLFASPRPEVEPERKVIGLRHDSGKSREGSSQ